MSLHIEMTRESLRRIDRLERLSPRIMRRARGRAANAAKRALFGTIKRHGNPKYGVEKLTKRDPFTVAINGGKRGDVFGRFSSDPSYLVNYIRNGEQVIGWVDKLNGWMSALQSAKHCDFTPAQIRMFKARLREQGKDGVKLPSSYRRPERDVIAPFSAAMVDKYPEWIIGNFEKMYVKEVAR